MADKESNMTTALPQGTWVRLTRDLTDFHSQNRPQGFEFEIEEFVTAGDPSKDEVAVDFYYGNADGGMGNVWAPADAVEVVRTVEQQEARKLPTRAQIADAVGIEMLGDFDGFQTSETVPDSKVTREVYGVTDEGLTFGFRIRIEQVWRTDP